MLSDREHDAAAPAMERVLADAEKRAIKVALALAVLRDSDAARGGGTVAETGRGGSGRGASAAGRDAVAAACAAKAGDVLLAAAPPPSGGDALVRELEVLGRTRLEARPELMGRFLRATARVARELPASAPRVAELARSVGRGVEAAPGSFASGLAASFLRLLGAAHDGALAACVLHGLDGVLGDAAVELLGAADLDARAACLGRCEPLLLVFAAVLVRALPALSREDRGAAAEMLARLVQDFEHAPLPHAFLVDLAHAALPALRDARAAPAAGGKKKKRRRADA